MDAHEQEHILICTYTYTYTYRYKQTINNTARILVYRLSPTKFLYTISIKDYKKTVSLIGQRSMWNVFIAELVKILQWDHLLVAHIHTHTHKMSVSWTIVASTAWFLAWWLMALWNPLPYIVQGYQRLYKPLRDVLQIFKVSSSLWCYNWLFKGQNFLNTKSESSR